MTSDERDSGSEPTHPDTFDEYQVTDHIAGGSYGVVFKVRSPADTEFALKWLRLDATDQGRLRFQNEIWALASFPSLFARPRGMKLGGVAASRT
ncbi:MAG: hypothetical protein ACREA0_18665, partial [bacterium]